jgi:hypothetical protein
LLTEVKRTFEKMIGTSVIELKYDGQSKVEQCIPMVKVKWVVEGAAPVKEVYKPNLLMNSVE